MSYELQRKPWKVWMSSRPDPTAVLVSLRDLLNGTTLQHDILIYNGNVYTSGTFSGSSFSEFYRYYIDISPARFDKMSKAKAVNIDASNSTYIKTLLGTGTSNLTVYYQDKDAALYPEDVKSMFAVNDIWKTYFRNNSILTADDLTTSYVTADMFTAAVAADDGNDYTDIVVSDEDSVFSATMVFEDGKKAYTKIRLNSDSNTNKVVRLIVGTLLFNSDKISYLQTIADSYNKNTESTINAVKNWAINLINDTSSNDVLSHLYVWVKAPFAADYIDPADFNQDLNQDSNVTFANVLVANDYDSIRNNFNRYNESISYTDVTTTPEYIEKVSRPYCPTNSPLKDLLSDGLLGSIKKDTVKDTAAALINDSYESTSIIGSVLTAPGSAQEQYNTSSTPTRYTPFNFYDPESREDADYYSNLGRIPTIIGKSGNFTTDGRIMSPTIDEIWYIIKKLISGNKNADDTRLGTVVSENYDGDTSLSEAVSSRYNFKADNKSVLADPIDFKYTYANDGSVSGVNPSEWVSQPTEISHKVFTYTKEYSKMLNTFFDEQNEEEKETRRVENTGDSLVLNNSFNLGISDAEYGPRSSAPLSLRELEAAMLGNKYNIDNNFIFATKTYAVTGKFGKVIKNDNNDIISGGSLYQMHRDYNAKVDNPNTYFKINGDGIDGYDATFGDLNGEEEKNGKIKVYLLDKNHKRTSETSVSKMPLLVEHYGNSSLLSEKQGSYSGSDVYMAADGTWRYKTEHIRLPILRSRF